jgi:sodium/proline symporter
MTFDTNPWVIGVVAGYLLVTLLIGAWATRRTRSSADFFVAGRSLGMFVMAIAAFASVQSGFGILGGTGITFSAGLTFVTGIGFAAVLGFGLAWFLVGRRLFDLGQQGEVYTVGDVVERRYGSKAVRGAMALAIVLGVVGYLGTQVQAMGVVMGAIFGIDLVPAALIGLAVLGVYAIGGGTIAAVYTDVFQGVLMIGVSIVISFYAFNRAGGVAEVTATLREESAALAGPVGGMPVLTFVCWLLLFAVGAAAQPQLLTKFLMIRDTKQLKWGAFTASLAYMATMMMVVGVGLTALAFSLRGEFPELGGPDQALPAFLAEYTAPVFAGLVMAAILSAIMSTGDAFVNLGAAALVRDLPRAFGHEVRRELLWSRVAVAALLVTSVMAAFFFDTLVALLGVFGWGTFAAALFPSVVLGMVWRGATRQAALTSILLSLAINFVLEVGGIYGFAPLPEGVVNGAFALAVSTIVFISVSLATRSSAGTPDEAVARQVGEAQPAAR